MYDCAYGCTTLSYAVNDPIAALQASDGATYPPPTTVVSGTRLTFEGVYNFYSYRRLANEAMCIASNDGGYPEWTGPQPVSQTTLITSVGNKSIVMTRSATFTLRCNGRSGSPIGRLLTLHIEVGAAPPPTQNPSCTISPSSATTGQTITATGAGGSGATYNWSTQAGSGANPASGTNSRTFITQFSTAGTKTISVSNTAGSGSGTCTIQVAAAQNSCDLNRVCADKGESLRFQIDSNPTGKHAYRFLTKNGVLQFNGIDDGITPLSVIMPSSMNAGSGLTPGDYEIYYKVGSTINDAVMTTAKTFKVVDCRIPPNTDDNATLTVQPASATVQIGQTKSFVALFDQDGAGSGFTPRDVTNESLWSAASSSVASTSVSVPGVFVGVSTGTTVVNAQYITPSGRTMNGNAQLSVNSGTLSVILNVNPATGDAPLPVNMTAVTDGTLEGNTDYYFWWNCNYPLTGTLSIAAVNAVCGDLNSPQNSDKGAYFPNLAIPTQSVAHTYSQAGTYTPLVLVKRGTGSGARLAIDKKSVSVSQAGVSCSSFTVSPTQYLCKTHVQGGVTIIDSCQPVPQSTPPNALPTFSWSCSGSPSCEVRVRGSASAAGGCVSTQSSCSLSALPNYTTFYELWCDGKKVDGIDAVKIRLTASDGHEINPP